MKFELNKNFKNSKSESRVCRETSQAYFLDTREYKKYPARLTTVISQLGTSGPGERRFKILDRSHFLNLYKPQLLSAVARTFFWKNEQLI